MDYIVAKDSAKFISIEEPLRTVSETGHLRSTSCRN